jgi:hypothetical protein
MLYPTLWAYRTSVKTSTSFSPFQLVHGVESILPIECEIPSLRLVVVLLPDTFDLEQCLVHLESLDEQRRDASMAIKENKRHVKVQYDKSIYVLGSTLRVTWSFYMIKPKNHWGKASSNPCGTVPISCDMS